MKRTILFLGFMTLSLSLAYGDSFIRSGMKDYDQKRSALPNTGNYYCVPTSYIDAFMYMGEHGMPQVDGGFTSSYSDINSFLAIMGVFMETDPYHGTGGGKAYSIAKNWISQRTSHALYHFRFGPDSNWGTGTIRNQLLTFGMVVIGRGKYQWDGTKYNRIGGHAVSVAGFDYPSSGNKYLKVYDPNDDDNLNSQSSFTLTNKVAGNLTVPIAGQGNRTLSRYTTSTGSNGDLLYLIDGMHTMMPTFAGWFNGTGAGTTFTVHWPWTWEDPSHSSAQTMTYTTPNTPIDWCFDLGETALYYLTSNGQVHRVDVVDQSDTTLTTIAGANKITVGGASRDIFVLKKVVLSINDSLVKINRNDNSLTTRGVSGHLLDIDWDVKGDCLTSISTSQSTVLRHNENLGLISTDRVLSLSYSLPNFFADTYYSVDHNTGDILLGTQGTNAFQRLRRSGKKWVATSHDLRVSSGLQAILPGENDLIFVQDGLTLWTVDQLGMPVNTDFSGLAVGSQLQTSKSFEATHPGSTSGPGWDTEDIDPES